MKRDLTVSVCLASYNGEKYIQEQIESILKQLTSDDELIVSDDGSTDNTMEIIDDLKKDNQNIKIIKGPHMGFSCNFGNAARYAKGNIILFSDQDDLWIGNKVDEIHKCFQNNPDCTTTLHEMATFRGDSDVDTNEIPITYHTGIMRNFIKSSYWGCCMAVRREFLECFLPFREYCVGHDQLIGLITEKYGKCYYIDKKLIKHRLHDSNTSNRRKFFEMFAFRKELLKDFKFANNRFVSSRKDGGLI